MLLVEHGVDGLHQGHLLPHLGNSRYVAVMRTSLAGGPLGFCSSFFADAFSRVSEVADVLHPPSQLFRKSGNHRCRCLLLVPGYLM